MIFSSFFFPKRELAITFLRFVQEANQEVPNFDPHTQGEEVVYISVVFSLLRCYWDKSRVSKIGHSLNVSWSTVENISKPFKETIEQFIEIWNEVKYALFYRFQIDNFDTS